METRSKILKKSPQKSIDGEDRLSNLPEHLIHRILSYLPSTKDAVRTSVLSKTWRHKWKEVTNLVFTAKNLRMKELIKSIDRALILYPNEKVEKFVIQMDRFRLTQLSSKKMAKWIRFATSRSVKEINLDLDYNYLYTGNSNFMLPEFFYSNTSLIKLQTIHCDFSPIGSVRWPSLKSLQIGYSNLTNEVVASILSGSPLLESLELDSCSNPRFDRLHIDSKYLKRLCLGSLYICSGNSLKVSGSSVECLEIVGNSVFKDILEVDLPSLVTATIDSFGTNEMPGRPDLKIVSSLFQKIMLMNAKELTIGRFLKDISLWELEAKSYPVADQTYTMSETKCIVIKVACYESFLYYTPGTVSLLRASPKLERLVISFAGKLPVFRFSEKILEYYNFAKCLMSQKETFTCFSLHLKTVEVFGLNVCDNETELLLVFLEFLLKNAVVLEKMVIHYSQDLDVKGGTDLMLEIAKKLLSFPRTSPEVVILFQE